jgi:hypothetical protein
MLEGIYAKKALNELSPVLTKLGRELESVERVKNPIDRVVELFRVVSPYHDAEVAEGKIAATLEKVRSANKGGKFKSEVETLEGISAHIKNAGRSEFGWNRTKPGEGVTHDKVFLGNTHGLWTFPASEWKATIAKGDPEAQRIIEHQAASFADSHIKPLRELAGSLSRERS